jgi:hypothetical protein
MKKIPGYRSDFLQEVEEITGALGHEMKKRDTHGSDYGLEEATMARYLRLNRLIPVLKERFDNGGIGMRVAEALSFLRNEEQEIVNRILEDSKDDSSLENGKKISIIQADRLRERSEEDELTEASIKEILDR